MHLCISYFYESSRNNSRQQFFCHTVIKDRAGHNFDCMLESKGFRHPKFKDFKGAIWQNFAIFEIPLNK